jgi:hypothetical protein
MSAAQFSSGVAALGPAFEAWTFAGIFCSGACAASADCGTTGAAYQTLVAETAGIGGDFCDLQNAMSDLASRIVAGARLTCAWDLPVPPGEAVDPRLVNVNVTLPGGTTETVPYVASAADCGTQSAWYYDNPLAPTRFIFCPAACRAVEALRDVVVDVMYGCATAA